MICTTVRNGVDCTFMTKKGCSYNGGACHEIVEQCKGCNRIIEFDSASYCGTVPEPSLKWKHGICNLATHVKMAATTTQAKLNPIKASKRAARQK